MFPELNHPILPDEELAKLVASYQAGETAVFDTILAHNERLIYQLAIKTKRTCGDTPLEDLMQYGRMGLLRALQTYDPGRGVKFTTYAVYWIRQRMIRNGRHDGFTVSFPCHVHEKRGRAIYQRSVLALEYQREPTLEEMQERTGLKEVYIQSLKISVRSLDTPVGEEDQTTTGEMMADPSINVEDSAFHALESDLLRKAIDKISEPNRKLLILRYGLNGKKPMSYQQIATRLSLKRGKVQYMCDQALQELRNTMRITTQR